MTRDAPSRLCTCGYGLGPRINAGGRISEADLGLRLLLCDDAGRCPRAGAERLDAVNRQRVDRGSAAYWKVRWQQAEAQINSRRENTCSSSAATNGIAGVVGIVASRVRERFNRPALVGGRAGALLKGSGRSVPGLDLGAAVIAARQSGLLLTGGGHAMAAGFTLQADQATAFHEFIDSRLAAAAALPLAADLGIEATVAVPGATVELATHLQRLAPYGPGNEEPVFVVPRARVVRWDRLGAEGGTIRAFVEGEGGGGRLKAMLFRAREEGVVTALTTGGLALHLAGQLRAESWNGSTTVSLSIADAALA